MYEFHLDYAIFIGLSLGSLALLHYWIRRSRQGEGIDRKVWTLLIVGLAGGQFLVNRAGESERDHLREMVEGFAPTYAEELKRMGHSRITLDTPANDPLYLSMIDAQIQWLHVNQAVTDIYTFKKRPDGAYVLVVDSETDYDKNGQYKGDRENRTVIGEVFDEADEALGRAFAGEAIFEDEPYTDRWGTWVSAFVPMYDQHGRVDAVLGADYPAASWVKAITWKRAGIIGFLTIVEVILIVSTSIISILRAEIAKRKVAERIIATHNEELEHTVEKRSKDLLEAQRQILQNEKLASVGQLAAGVAHEINTPIQYVGDNLRALSGFVGDLTGLVNQYRELVQLVKTGGVTPEAIAAVEKAEQEQDLEFILGDAPEAIHQGLDGVQRVANIVRAMKVFSHFREEASTVDLIQALESTLVVAKNEYKYVADVKTEFEEIPAVECHASELNQVFLNLIVNAAHAISDTGKRGTITIKARPYNGDRVEIAIGDTGTGIPEKIRQKIFDPFFTTKGVGKGTGQGLSIAHSIVVRKHGGVLTFDTEVGKGTTFFIRLPIKVRQSEKGVEAEHEPATNLIC